MTKPPASLEDYRIELDAYAGPLDLLLLLVKRNEIDLHDIPMARLTDQYMQHLKLIEQIDMDLAGEFLVMAATLVEIKSQMLIPRDESQQPEPDEQGYDQLDPRYELIQQLLAYKRYKDAAMQLDQRRETWEQRFARVPAKRRRGGSGEGEGADQQENAEPIEIDLEDASVLDLCEAFARILDTIGQGPARHEVTYDDTPIALHAEDIVDRLTRDGEMSLQQLFVGRRGRSEMIGLFLATLELVRQKRLKVIQDQPGGQIALQLRQDDPQQDMDDREVDWRDPDTGQMQYDWPSEKARLRAERRARLRAKWAAKAAEQGDEQEEDDDVDEQDDELDDDENIS